MIRRAENLSVCECVSLCVLTVYPSVSIYLSDLKVLSQKSLLQTMFFPFPIPGLCSGCRAEQRAGSSEQEESRRETVSVFQEQRSMTEMLKDHSVTSYNLFLVVALFARLVYSQAEKTCCCAETPNNLTALPLLLRGETSSAASSPIRSSAAAAPAVASHLETTTAGTFRTARQSGNGRSTGATETAETEECTFTADL